MNMVVIDIVFIIIILVSVLRCGVKGFVSELLSMAGIILGTLVAIFFFRAAGQVIRNQFMQDMPVVPEAIAFVVLFLAVFAVVKIVEMLLKSIIETIQFGAADRFLGTLLGFAEGIVVVCLLLLLLSIQPFFDSKPLLEGSFIAERLLPFVMGNTEKMSEKLQEVIALL